MAKVFFIGLTVGGEVRIDGLQVPGAKSDMGAFTLALTMQETHREPAQNKKDGEGTGKGGLANGVANPVAHPMRKGWVSGLSDSDSTPDVFFKTLRQRRLGVVRTKESTQLRIGFEKFV